MVDVIFDKDGSRSRVVAAALDPRARVQQQNDGRLQILSALRTSKGWLALRLHEPPSHFELVAVDLSEEQLTLSLSPTPLGRPIAEALVLTGLGRSRGRSLRVPIRVQPAEPGQSPQVDRLVMETRRLFPLTGASSGTYLVGVPIPVEQLQSSESTDQRSGRGRGATERVWPISAPAANATDMLVLEQQSNSFPDQQVSADLGCDEPHRMFLVDALLDPERDLRLRIRPRPGITRDLTELQGHPADI